MRKYDVLSSPDNLLDLTNMTHIKINKHKFYIVVSNKHLQRTVETMIGKFKLNESNSHHDNQVHHNTLFPIMFPMMWLKYSLRLLES